MMVVRLSYLRNAVRTLRSAVVLVCVFPPTHLAGQVATQQLSLSEFERLCASAASPLFENINDARRLSISDQRRRLNRIIGESLPRADQPQLSALWAPIQQRAGEGLALLAIIDSIEENKPSNWNLLWKVLTTNDTDKQKNERDFEIFKRLAMEGGEVGLRQKFHELDQELNESIVALAVLRGNYQAAEVPDGISLSYWPSWNGVYAGDCLRFRNNTGVNLLNTVLITSLKGSSGQSASHVHHVDNWAPGAYLNAYYWADEDGYSTTETVSDPSEVDVVAYSASSVLTTRYQLTPDEWDKVIEEYCSKLQVSGTFLGNYVEDGSGQPYAPGLKFRFSGIRSLPVTSVTIQFSDGAEWQGDVWGGAKTLQPNEDYSYRSERFLNGSPAFDRVSPPKHIWLTLGLANSRRPWRFEIY